MMEELLERLCKAKGVSGNEREVAKILEEELAPFVEKTWKDNFGNLIFESGGNGPAVVIVAHMDEIGGMVKHVDKEGFLYFVDIGSNNPQQLVGSRVLVGEGLPGVIQTKKKGKDLKVEDLYIDAGAGGPDELKELGIGPGTLIVGGPSYDRLMGQRRISKSFDNRAGVCVMAETMKRAADTGCRLIAAASCQEEVGVRGAKVLSNYIEADYVFALDVTFAVDTPQRSSDRDMNTCLGKGPAITLKDDHYLMRPDVRRFVEGVAERHGIPLQYDISTGGTDAGPLYVSKGVSVTVPILIPLRYMHTSSEVLDLGDLEQCVRLLLGLIEEIDSHAKK